MRPAIQGARFLREPAEETARGFVCADASKQIGNRFGIAHRAEKSLNPRGGEGGEEIAQIHAQDNSLTRVRSGERPDGSLFEESVHARMGWDALQNFGQDLS